MAEEKLKVPEDTQWREIPGHPGYWISNRKHVFSMKSKSLKKQCKGNGPGKIVLLYYGKSQRSRLSVDKVYKEVWG